MVVPSDDPTARLLAPVRELVDRALVAIGSRDPVRVRTADIEGVYRLQGDELLLSTGLLGPAVHHPLEPDGPVPPIDRWRRAAASVLEAAALLRLAHVTRQEVGSDWRWVGAAIYATDRAAPELAIAEPDLALAIATGDPGRFPRAGVAVFRAWQAMGREPLDQVRYLLTGGVLSSAEWLEIGRWVGSAAGAASALSVVVERPADSDIPCEVPPWSWRPLRVPAHPRGGFVKVEGEGAVGEPWAAGGHELRTLAAAAATTCRFAPMAGGPVGSWDVASAEGFGQVMGARGIRYDFHADGRVDVVLADAFVGPLAAVAMADNLGTSGVAEGRWRVAGPYSLAFYDLQTQSMTLHSRTRDRFVMPARGFGLAEWLKALVEQPWVWQVNGDRMVLRGRMMGGEVEVRLKRD